MADSITPQAHILASLDRIEHTLDTMIADEKKAKAERALAAAFAENRTLLQECLRIIRGGKR